MLVCTSQSGNTQYASRLTPQFVPRMEFIPENALAVKLNMTWGARSNQGKFVLSESVRPNNWSVLLAPSFVAFSWDEMGGV
jgi:hypothetical protein